MFDLNLDKSGPLVIQEVEFDLLEKVVNFIYSGKIIIRDDIILRFKKTIKYLRISIPLFKARVGDDVASEQMRRLHTTKRKMGDDSDSVTTAGRTSPHKRRRRRPPPFNVSFRSVQSIHSSRVLSPNQSFSSYLENLISPNSVRFQRPSVT